MRNNINKQDSSKEKSSDNVLADIPDDSDESREPKEEQREDSQDEQSEPEQSEPEQSKPNKIEKE